MSAKLSIKTVVQLHNGISMPLYGLGTYKSINTIEQAIQTAYFTCQMTHLDTAAFYQNEAEIGSAIKKLQIPRQNLFITSKLWYTEHGYEKTLAAFKQTIEKLDTDYLDLYLVHWPGTTDESNNAQLRRETWRAMEELYQQGKCKAIGVSNYTEKHLREMLDNDSPSKVNVVPMVNQFELHPKLTQKPLIQYCRDHGIVVESYSPFAKGKLLSDTKLQEIANKYQVNIPQLIIRWLLQQEIVCIPKSEKPERIIENANVFHFEISEEDMKRIDNMNEDFHCTWNPYEIE